MTVAEATPDLEQVDRHDRAFLGHPKGLGFLGFTEACERFSYYSMQTLLVLYMVNYLLLPGRMEKVIGLTWLQTHVYHGISGQPLASAIFGTYTSLVYGTPIVGGIIADKWLGRNKTLILGGVLMAIGHFLMAIEPAFIFALVALLLGVGAFKGNIATQVGALYGPNDLRRAMAFQIFYIFINVSVIVAPLISGTLGQKVGWHYGFGCAGVVMVLGLIIYLSGRKYLPAEDLAAPAEESAPREPLTRDDWMCVLYLVILIPVLAVSLLTNQEIFNAYLTWGDQQFDLTLLNHTSSWLITLDATVGFGMLVCVALFWKLWSVKFREPDEISKMIIGSVFTVGGVDPAPRRQNKPVLADVF
jgi:POT family proton-dependent oligopeptide transporter